MYIRGRMSGRKRSNPIINELVADKIRRLRIRKGLSQQSLADMIGITRTTFSSIESGANQATLNLLLELSIALECDLGDLLPLKSEILQKSNKINSNNELSKIKEGFQSHGVEIDIEKIVLKHNI